MGQDCLWDSEKQHREWTEQLICSLFMYGMRLLLGVQRATQRIYCTADLLLVYVWNKTVSETRRSTMLVILTLWSVAQYLINFSTCLYAGPLGQDKLDHQKGAPRSSRGSLVPE